MTPSPRLLRGGLKWPAMRGARLLHALTSSQKEEHGDKVTAFNEAFPYDVELCVPTAGHVALVLVQKAAELQLQAAVTCQPVTPTNHAPAAPRVVYVLDALPLSTRGTRDEPSQTQKSKPSGGQFLSQPVDEMELLEELFAPSTRATGGNDGSVVVKPPMLCARFECPVISIQFIRGRGDLQPLAKGQSKSVGFFATSRLASAMPLRCIVAREDGMAFLWEWQADLFQWVFLNRLCFLENPNLKWTKPVAVFTTMELPLDSQVAGLCEKTSNVGASGATELVWWSTATKHEPKLKLRRLRFDRATDALRATDIIVGSAFTLNPSCDDIVKLLSSKLGLYAISRTQGVFFRSSTASLQTTHLSWQAIFSSVEASVASAMAGCMTCVHTVTGELVLFDRETATLYLLTPNSRTISTSEASSNTKGPSSSLFARKLTTLVSWQQSDHNREDQREEVLDVAAHRHVFLVLTSHLIRVYTLISGALLEIITLANANLCGEKSCKFWTVPGASSAIGLWNASGFWTLRVPPARAIATQLHPSQLSSQDEVHEDNPKAAFLAVKDYGTGELQLEAVRYALEVLKRVTHSAMDPAQSQPEAWEVVWNTVSSPAFLLALLDNRAPSENLVHELAQVVAAIYKTASGIRSFGRLDGAGASCLENHLLRLTPANLESLHHLSNWIVLAKRKLARLEASSHVHLTEPTSFLDEFSAWPVRAASDLTIVLANEDDLSTAVAERKLQRKDSIVDSGDARNFRLSRKLRPMSSLRFAAGCSTSSERQGRQWLAQLESFLLDGVAFKTHQVVAAHSKCKADATPSHRLFHSERVLADFRHVAASSFSKHMYLESMSRLYLLYEPESLLPFLRCVERFCPRLFTLSGHQPLVRSNAERAMTLFPPLKRLIEKVLEDKESTTGRAAKASLLAYVDLLGYCGLHMEACRALLQCHLYDESKEKFMLLLKGPHDAQKPSENEQEDGGQARTTTASSLYFLLLGYCMEHCDATELKQLLLLKPAHVDLLHILRALQTTFSSKNSKNGKAGAPAVTIGDLRSVLAALMHQRRTDMMDAHEII